jgi:hypothetical protein
MRVFISWSGHLSRSVAETVRFWLRQVIPGLDLFVSSEDIQKGDVWLVTLLDELERSSIGIVCVTRENLHSDWLVFEAGALAIRVGRSKVCTLLIDVSPIEVDPPLSSFQATTLKKDDVFRLLRMIHASRNPPLYSDRELEENFEMWWPRLESNIRKALEVPIESRTPIQQLAEELLLPVTYHEARAGGVDTVFQWLQTAKRRHVADLEGQLGFVEACLARITGKPGAGHSLLQLSAKASSHKCLAHLEWLFLHFAANRTIDEIRSELTCLDAYPDAPRRTAAALVGLWHLREGRPEDARRCLASASPDSVSGDAYGYYRAIPLGILCFAVGDGSLGEKHFDVAKTMPSLPNEGYPFISLLWELDRAFVNACIGYGNRSISKLRIREFKGHALVLAQYADVFRRNVQAVQSLIERSSLWMRPLQPQSIANRLRQFQKALIENSGGPVRP